MYLAIKKPLYYFNIPVLSLLVWLFFSRIVQSSAPFFFLIMKVINDTNSPICVPHQEKRDSPLCAKETDKDIGAKLYSQNIR